MVNPWQVTGGDELLSKMVDYFTAWCTFLPRINGNQDNRLIENDRVIRRQYLQNPLQYDTVLDVPASEITGGVSG